MLILEIDGRETKSSFLSKHSLVDYNNKTVIGLFDEALNKFYVVKKVS